MKKLLSIPKYIALGIGFTILLFAGLISLVAYGFFWLAGVDAERYVDDL